MGSDRVYNFSAGPSVLPETVLEQAAGEMLNYKGSGMSVMEMSHRSKIFMEINDELESLVRRLLGVPENYKVLFLQGGASSQFAMVPMNLMKSGKADYAVTGSFAKKACSEAKKYGDIHVAFDGSAGGFKRIPAQGELSLRPDADYFHMCENNTIYGTKWPFLPDTGAVPIVSDMSSCIFSEPIDVSKYGLIYAGAQKNIGPAGVTLVIVRDDLIGKAADFTPSMFDYAIHAKNSSLYNTPASYSVYLCMLVLRHVEKIGGLSAMHKHNTEKAKLLYDFLDESAFFTGLADAGSRSMMNVLFKTPSEELDADFVKQAAAAGFASLKGHRETGHMRASIYNAMPAEGIAALVAFMKDFEAKNK